MRVIAGRARGHKLNAPKDLQIRPTSDKVKESIFNIIQNNLYDKVIIDLFSGTGNLGIEALSRSAKKAYFIDYNKDSIAIIKGNLDKTKFIEQSEVIHADVITAIGRLAKKNVQADVIFIDPPYNKGLAIVAVEHIVKERLLSSSGMIIIEHDKLEDIPEEIYRTIRFRRKDYGKTSVSFYKQKEEL